MRNLMCTCISQQGQQNILPVPVSGGEGGGGLTVT